MHVEKLNRKAQRLGHLLGKPVTLGSEEYDPAIVLSPSRHIQVNESAYFLVVDEDGVGVFTPITRQAILANYGPTL
jgi:hypothetical protein